MAHALLACRVGTHADAWLSFAYLKELQSAFIAIGSIDPFASEDVEYAQQLPAAGVAVELNVVPGSFRAFDGIAPIPACPASSRRRGIKP